jgi:hypothetical protein
MGWAPIISAGAQLLGAATSAYGASKQLSERDAMEAQSAFNWAQHKKSLLEGPSLEMRGLKAAGINPLLRYGQHGTPMTSTAQGVSSQGARNPWDQTGGLLADAGSSAVDAFRKSAEVDKIEADINKIGTEITKLEADTRLSDADRELREQQLYTELQRTFLTAAQNTLTNAQYSQVVALTRVANQDLVLKKLDEQIKQKGADLANLSMAVLLDIFAIGNDAADAVTSGGNSVRSYLEGKSLLDLLNPF